MNDLLIFLEKTANFSCELWGGGVTQTLLETEFRYAICLPSSFKISFDLVAWENRGHSLCPYSRSVASISSSLGRSVMSGPGPAARG